MEETTFVADPMRLMIAALAGIIVLLVLIIRFKLHPVLSMMISAIIIGIGAGMPLTMISDTVEKGVGKTLQGIALLVGLGSMFGGILEVSGGAQRIAETLINKFGQKKAGWALGLTGLVIGTTVFFEAGVKILLPIKPPQVIPETSIQINAVGTPTMIMVPKFTPSAFATSTDPADGGTKA